MHSTEWYAAKGLLSPFNYKHLLNVKFRFNVHQRASEHRFILIFSRPPPRFPRRYLLYDRDCLHMNFSSCTTHFCHLRHALTRLLLLDPTDIIHYFHSLARRSANSSKCQTLNNASVFILVHLETHLYIDFMYILCDNNV